MEGLPCASYVQLSGLGGDFYLCLPCLYFSTNAFAKLMFHACFKVAGSFCKTCMTALGIFLEKVCSAVVPAKPAFTEVHV